MMTTTSLVVHLRGDYIFIIMAGGEGPRVCLCHASRTNRMISGNGGVSSVQIPNDSPFGVVTSRAEWTLN